MRSGKAGLARRGDPVHNRPVQPLNELLHRIKWDAEFGKGEFAIGYYDRVAQEEQLVPFVSIRRDPQRPDTFSYHDEDGIVRHIPLHRVRTVYKDGVVVWRRPGSPLVTTPTAS